MSKEHKAALAQGRAEGRAVRQYLEALAASKPKRGRKRTPASIRSRLEAVEAELDRATPYDKLHLTQEHYDLTAELARLEGPTVDMSTLEADFIQAAAGYAERKGLTYAAFRAVGVTPSVLDKAGIRRGR
ncbi:hypothetical protein BH23ACT2_BH23ACT2_09730 [soil metagenome]